MSIEELEKELKKEKLKNKVFRSIFKTFYEEIKSQLPKAFVKDVDNAFSQLDAMDKL